MNKAIALIISSLLTTNALNDKSMEGTGFSAEGTVILDNLLEGNLQIIGAHLHTGWEYTNGPVNIIFCGGYPLPDVLGINGECDDLFDQRVERNILNLADWEALTSMGAWEDGANKATSIANATTLADGCGFLIGYHRK